MNDSPETLKIWEAYRAYLARSYREDFGIVNQVLSDQVAHDWFYADERHDHLLEEMRARLPQAARILDLASGMGTTVLRALDTGLDAYGIEPDSEKLGLMHARIDAETNRKNSSWRPAWKGRFVRAVGETLPFGENSFDVILSYQTLEHVQNPAAVLTEMLRVVRAGGALHLRCPDYSGTFEGHYLLPWLPLLPRPLAHLYLRLLGRPVSGFKGIHYITKHRAVKLLRKAAERAGVKVTITDVERVRYQQRLRGKGLPGWKGPALPWRALYYFKRTFRTELQMNLWVDVRKPA